MPDDAPPDHSDPSAPARLLVHQRLREQVALLDEQAGPARAGEAGGVHEVRRVCRRLRAALATYRPLLDRDVTDPVREELRWLTRALGDARDHEVVDRQVEELVEALDPVLVVGPVRQRMRGDHESAAATGRTEVGEAMGSERYAALSAALHDLVEAPPWTAKAERPAADVLPRLVHKEWKRLRRRHRSAMDPHDVRKGAKRMRYAYEVLEPAWGKQAKKPRKAAQELTRVLGDRQDGVVAMALLLELSREASAAGENAFTYGLLYAEQQAREPELLAEAERVWQRLARLSW